MQVRAYQKGALFFCLGSRCQYLDIPPKSPFEKGGLVAALQ